MDVKSLKAKIKSKKLPNYMIFSGDEWKVQDIYIQQIAKVTGKEVVRIDNFSQIYRKLQSKSFDNKSYIYIVRDDKELMQNEKVQKLIDDGILKDNILIHLLTSVDKRTKFYKAYKSVICDFERLSDSMLKKYTLKEINLSERNLERLIDICESDYGRILLEVDKIKRYVASDRPLFGEGKSSTEEDLAFSMLVKDGNIYNPPYDAIFDLVDAILGRRVNEAFDLLEQSYAVGEATMVMLTVLYNNAKALLQVQSYGGDNISKSTGLTPFQIKNVKKHVGKHSEEELIYILRLVHKVTNGIKTGIMEDAFAMQYLLVHIM